MLLINFLSFLYMAETAPLATVNRGSAIKITFIEPSNVSGRFRSKSSFITDGRRAFDPESTFQSGKFNKDKFLRENGFLRNGTFQSGILYPKDFNGMNVNKNLGFHDADGDEFDAVHSNGNFEKFSNIPYLPIFFGGNGGFSGSSSNAASQSFGNREYGGSSSNAASQSFATGPGSSTGSVSHASSTGGGFGSGSHSVSSAFSGSFSGK